LPRWRFITPRSGVRVCPATNILFSLNDLQHLPESHVFDFAEIADNEIVSIQNLGMTLAVLLRKEAHHNDNLFRLVSRTVLKGLWEKLEHDVERSGINSLRF